MAEALTDRVPADSTGGTPEPLQLERFTDYLLLEELNNNYSDKVTQTEYPFFSERPTRPQTQKRNYGKS
ncbi:hypothetical protein [Paenibacillus larvae]|uniref:hypothetical protein n=1 Tax=Paenibacillus larvae TaxID=1464 RepID=UPI00288CD147|nr:hypothetical protein [Paenibacillus larvae]MDT2230697.1 hypothetical protein [Paenibacillus larvae]